jgi:alkaline phosphatase
MMRNIKLLVLVLLIASLTSCQSKKSEKKDEVKNIILLIGDGMGLAQVYAGMSVAKSPLNIERSQFFGFSKTYSANRYTTDSGAGATALSSGKKTYSGAIAIDSNRQTLKIITEYAHEAGIATGVIATCELVHATPAAFITHNVSRRNYDELARGFLNAQIDLYIGGGYFRFDSLGVTDSLERLGYQIQPEIAKIDITSLEPVLSLPYLKHPPRMLDGRGNFLPDATNIALQKLSNYKKGFFIMIEGSQIDWGGHDNDIEYVTSEMIDFDNAVGVAYDFADNNPGTLVIVTADHETGGLFISNGNIKDKTITTGFGSTSHTGVMVPIFAYGTGAEEFSAIMENTEIFNKMMSALGLEK